MAAFTGQLNVNEIFAALYNMIISQQVFADNIKGTYSSLADKSRVDGSLYGDQKLYYATDALSSSAWGADAEATNLLALHRPPAPECQAIVLDVFRQISLTVDNYLTKRAWSTEQAFSDFNGVMLQWIRETKRIYDATRFNAYVGNHKSAATKATVSIDVTAAVGAATGEEAARLEGQAIAEGLANLFVEMKDISRDFNDYEFLRSYAMEDLVVVWNSIWANKIKKVDLPTIFHQDGLVEKFEEEVLPSRYFGTIISALDATYTGTVGAAQVIRVLEETTVTVGGVAYHLFAGDKLPVGATYTANTVYVEDSNVICKVMHKKSVPLMSSFEVGTSFFNAKSLTENHYLTFGTNTLEYLKGLPFITVEKQ